MTDKRPIAETPLVPPTPVFPEAPKPAWPRVWLMFCAAVHGVLTLLAMQSIWFQCAWYISNGSNAGFFRQLLTDAYGICTLVIPAVAAVGHGVLALGLALRMRWAWLGSLVLPPVVIIAYIVDICCIGINSLAVIPPLLIYVFCYLVVAALLLRPLIRRAVRDRETPHA